jgi:hypothetical protein
MKLATHLHLLPRSKMVELYLHSPTCLQCIVLIGLINKTEGQLFILYLASVSKKGVCELDEEIKGAKQRKAS